MFTSRTRMKADVITDQDTRNQRNWQEHIHASVKVWRKEKNEKRLYSRYVAHAHDLDDETIIENRD